MGQVYYTIRLLLFSESEGLLMDLDCFVKRLEFELRCGTREFQNSEQGSSNFKKGLLTEKF